MNRLSQPLHIPDLSPRDNDDMNLLHHQMRSLLKSPLQDDNFFDSSYVLPPNVISNTICNYEYRIPIRTFIYPYWERPMEELMPSNTKGYGRTVKPRKVVISFVWGVFKALPSFLDL